MLGRPSHGHCKKATHSHVPTSKSLFDDIKDLPPGATMTMAHQALTSSLQGGAANTVVGTRGPRAAKYLLTKADREVFVKRVDEVTALATGHNNSIFQGNSDETILFSTFGNR